MIGVRVRAALRRRVVPLALLALLANCSSAPPEPTLELEPIGYGSLEEWRAADLGPALDAFRRSCARLEQRSPETAFGSEPAFGRVADWRPACAAGRDVGQRASDGDGHRFFERWFQPYRVSDRGDEDGLFTGYFEPLLDGSRTYGGRFVVPLHRVPDDLLLIDLSRFDPAFAGRRLIGRVDGDQVVPYFSRGEIDAGVLEGRELEILWVDDPIDKFFLQIQGSGRIRLDQGETVRVGYAGQNGHAYRAIGRDLIERGEVEPEHMSMQAIRAWMEEHPAAANELMSRNRSYVFFDEHSHLDPGEGPIGAQGVPLTAGHSLAVDPRFIPLGAPVWLETRVPWPEGEAPLRRLMVAQDTGGAIKGVVRGDVFFGSGPRAEAAAGRMKHPGRLVVLLPRTLTPVG